MCTATSRSARPRPSDAGNAAPGTDQTRRSLASDASPISDHVQLATPSDFFKMGRFKIEYPREMLRLRPSQAMAMKHTARMLYYMRKVFHYALGRLEHERSTQEKLLSDRSRLLMKVEDPLEMIFFGQGEKAQAFIDTDLIHGSRQRVRREQVLPMVLPLVTESSRAIRRIEAIRTTIYQHWKLYCGGNIVRIARGFVGRIKARKKRLAILHHFAALRIQAVWRGFYDRKYVIPRLLDNLRQRSSRVIARAWRHYTDNRTFRARARAKVWRNKVKCAIQIQRIWRGYYIRSRIIQIRARAADAKAMFENNRRQKLQAARARREHIKHHAATNIQRVWRGLLGRRLAYNRKQAGIVSNSRVRDLADRFLTSGDLWGFIAAINQDYERVEHEKNREITRAKAFVDQIIRVRQDNTEKAWKSWSSFRQGQQDRSEQEQTSGPPAWYEDAKRAAASDAIAQQGRDSFNLVRDPASRGLSNISRPATGISAVTSASGALPTSRMPPELIKFGRSVKVDRDVPPVDEYAYKLELLRDMYLKNVPGVGGSSMQSHLPAGAKPEPAWPTAIPSIYDHSPMRQAKQAVAQQERQAQQQVQAQQVKKNRMNDLARMAGAHISIGGAELAASAAGALSGASSSPIAKPSSSHSSPMPGALPKTDIGARKRAYPRGAEISNGASIRAILEPDAGDGGGGAVPGSGSRRAAGAASYPSSSRVAARTSANSSGKAGGVAAAGVGGGRRTSISSTTSMRSPSGKLTSPRAGGGSITSPSNAAQSGRSPYLADQSAAMRERPDIAAQPASWVDSLSSPPEQLMAQPAPASHVALGSQVPVSASALSPPLFPLPQDINAMAGVGVTASQLSAVRVPCQIASGPVGGAMHSGSLEHFAMSVGVSSPRVSPQSNTGDRNRGSGKPSSMPSRSASQGGDVSRSRTPTRSEVKRAQMLGVDLAAPGVTLHHKPDGSHPLDQFIPQSLIAAVEQSSSAKAADSNAAMSMKYLRNEMRRLESDPYSDQIDPASFAASLPAGQNQVSQPEMNYQQDAYPENSTIDGDDAFVGNQPYNGGSSIGTSMQHEAGNSLGLRSSPPGSALSSAVSHQGSVGPFHRMSTANFGASPTLSPDHLRTHAALQGGTGSNSNNYFGQDLYSPMTSPNASRVNTPAAAAHTASAGLHISRPTNNSQPQSQSQSQRQRSVRSALRTPGTPKRSPSRSSVGFDMTMANGIDGNLAFAHGNGLGNSSSVADGQFGAPAAARRRSSVKELPLPQLPKRTSISTDDVKAHLRQAMPDILNSMSRKVTNDVILKGNRVGWGKWSKKGDVGVRNILRRKSLDMTEGYAQVDHQALHTPMGRYEAMMKERRKSDPGEGFRPVTAPAGASGHGGDAGKSMIASISESSVGYDGQSGKLRRRFSLTTANVQQVATVNIPLRRSSIKGLARDARRADPSIVAGSASQRTHDGNEPPTVDLDEFMGSQQQAQFSMDTEPRPETAPAMFQKWRYEPIPFDKRPIEQQRLLLEHERKRQQSKLQGAAAGSLSSRTGYGVDAIIESGDASLGARAAVRDSTVAEGYDADGRPVDDSHQRQQRGTAEKEEDRLQDILARQEGNVDAIRRPYDDGWRDSTERQEAMARKRKMVEFAKPFERECARNIATSFVGALIATVAAAVEHVAVAKRGGERQAKLQERRQSLLKSTPGASKPADVVPSVLYNGQQMVSGFAHELEVGRSLIMLEDIYRMTGVKRDLADELPTRSDDGTDAPMSRLEAMQSRVDPSFRKSRGSKLDASAATGSAPLPPAHPQPASAGSTDDHSFVVPSQRSGTMSIPGVLASDGRIVSDIGYDTTALAADVMQSMGVSAVSVARKAKGAPLPRQPSYPASTSSSNAALLHTIGEESGRQQDLSSPSRSSTVSFKAGSPAQPHGFAGGGAGGFLRNSDDGSSDVDGSPEAWTTDGNDGDESLLPLEEVGRVDPGRPVGKAIKQLVTPALGYNAKDILKMAPLAEAKSVFHEEAVLQAHGLGVPGVRSLMVDVRGLEGPFDMLVYHAVLRSMPVPHAAIEEAREQGVIDSREYKQLRRISSAVGEDDELNQGGDDNDPGLDATGDLAFQASMSTIKNEAKAAAASVLSSASGNESPRAAGMGLAPIRNPSSSSSSRGRNVRRRGSDGGASVTTSAYAGSGASGSGSGSASSASPSRRPSIASTSRPDSVNGDGSRSPSRSSIRSRDRRRSAKLRRGGSFRGGNSSPSTGQFDSSETQSKSNARLWSQLDTHDQHGRRIRRGGGAQTNDPLAKAASIMEAEGAGELAARVLRELAPSLARVQWERKLHEAAFPIVAALRAKEVRVVSDLLKIDIGVFGINPTLVSVIKRLLGVLVAAMKLTTPSAVKAMYQVKPTSTAAAAVAGPTYQNSPLRDLPSKPLQLSATGSLASPGSASGNGGASNKPRAASLQSSNPKGKATHVGAHASKSGSSFYAPNGVISSSSNNNSRMATPSAVSSSPMVAPPGKPKSASYAGSLSSSSPPARTPTTKTQVGGLSGALSRTRQGDIRSALNEERAQSRGSVRPGEQMPSGSRGLGSPEGISQLVDPNAGSDLWQSSLLMSSSTEAAAEYTGGSGNGGGGARRAWSSPQASPSQAPAAAGSRSFSRGIGAAAGSTISGDGSRRIPRIMTPAANNRQPLFLETDYTPAPTTYSQPNLFLPFASTMKLPALMLSGGLPTRIPDTIVLPQGFEVLRRDHAMSTLHIADRIITKEEKVEAEEASKAAERIAEQRELAGRSKKRGMFLNSNEAEYGGRSTHGVTVSGQLTDARGNVLQNADRASSSILSVANTAKGMEKPPRDERIQSLSSILDDRLSIVLEVMNQSLNGISAVRGLDEPIDVAVIQCAFTLPLPMPRLTEMADARSNLRRDDYARHSVVVPYDVFLRQLCIVTPLLDILTQGLRSWVHQKPNSRPGSHPSRSPSRGDAAAASQRRNRNTAIEPMSEAEMRTAIEGALEELTIKSKPKMLIQERARSAQVVARPWISALAKRGFTRMGQLVRIPPQDLEAALREAYPVKIPSGSSHAEQCCLKYAESIPSYGVALLLESVVEYWVQSNESLRVEVFKASGAYDSRYLRSPTDPSRVGSRVTAKEQYHERAMTRAIKMPGSSAGYTSEFPLSIGSMIPATSWSRPQMGQPGVRMSGQQLGIINIARGSTSMPSSLMQVAAGYGGVASPSGSITSMASGFTGMETGMGASPASSFVAPPGQAHLQSMRHGGPSASSPFKSRAATASSASGYGSPAVLAHYSDPNNPSNLDNTGGDLTSQSVLQEYYDDVGRAGVGDTSGLQANPGDYEYNPGLQPLANTLSNGQKQGQGYDQHRAFDEVPDRLPPRILGIRDPRYRPITPFRSMADAKAGNIRYSTSRQGRGRSNPANAPPQASPNKGIDLLSRGPSLPPAII